MFRYCFIFIVIVCSYALASNEKTIFGFTPIYLEGSPRSSFESSNTLVALFPSGLFGPQQSGFNFEAKLQPGLVKAISYEIFFPHDFDFVNGGKLPGLCGGKIATGGKPATGTNGFSARIMWRKDGRIVSYVYHVDQADIYGDDFQWLTPDKSSLFVRKGIWHKVKMLIQLNEIGKKNGTIKAFMDGALAFEKSDFSFRFIGSIKIDNLCFNTFFGGGDATWAPHKDETLKIRNLKIEDFARR